MMRDLPPLRAGTRGHQTGRPFGDDFFDDEDDLRECVVDQVIWDKIKESEERLVIFVKAEKGSLCLADELPCHAVDATDGLVSDL